MPILRPEERVGTVLAERYRLDRILGKGGMGVVFAGLHTWTNRAIAVKLLLPHYAENGDLVKRFFQEARAAAALRHPHVIEVIDMGEDAAGDAYIVLEYLEGEPLSELLERDKKIDFGTLLEIVLPVMDALAEAHGKSILHRDLKPDNIYLVKGLRGRRHPKLLDFGIAKLLESETMATGTGGVLGTPAYMAPEQARGDKQLDARVDVWAMGIVCFQALTGRMPFVAETPTIVLAAILTTKAPPIRDVDPEVHPAIAKAIDRALAADRDLRTGSMAEMMKALIEAAIEAGIELDSSLLEYRDREAPAPPRASKASIDAAAPTPAPEQSTRDVRPRAKDEDPIPDTRPPDADAAPSAAPPPAPDPPRAVVEAPREAATAARREPEAKPRSRTLLFAGIGAAAAALLCAGLLVIPMVMAVNDESSIDVTNRAPHTIVSLYMRTTGRTRWGVDRLEGMPLPTNASVLLGEVPCAHYDVRYVDADGGECVVNNIEVCGGGEAYEIDESDFTCRELPP